MIPIAIQVSRSKVKVKGQAYSSYVGEGGISVLETSIFHFVMFLGFAQSGADPENKWNQLWYITPDRYCFSLGYAINLSVCMSALRLKYLKLASNFFTQKRT